MKKTNLVECKNMAKVLAHVDPVPGDFFVLHHPIFSSQSVLCEGEILNLVEEANIEEDNTEVVEEYVKILNNRVTYSEENFKKAVTEYLRNIEDIQKFSTLLLTINKPYRALYLKLCKDYLSEEDFAENLNIVWTCTEFPNVNPNVSIAEFKNMFKKVNKELLMNNEEYNTYINLPKTLTIYRGIHAKGKVKALSWTLDKEKAKWFANRFEKGGTVLEATIDRDFVLAVFLELKESEIVIDPRGLIDLKELKCN